VTWINEDGTYHTATDDAGEFDSGTIGPGDSFSIAFYVPGTYTYHCNYHTSMTATIIVE
jgi:plastocyanin